MMINDLNFIILRCAGRAQIVVFIFILGFFQPVFSYQIANEMNQTLPNSTFTAPEQNCTPSDLEDFPSDGLSPEQRRQGWIVLHVLIGIYATGALAIVCDDYFVPLMHEFTERLRIPSDIAGATFMAFGTSCPELFMSLIGAFITQGDIGVGAVIGSAVFNILGIASVCGLFAGTAIALNWRPLSRDCVWFLIAVASLYIVIEDEKIYWYEAMILVIEYLIYIVVLYLYTRYKHVFEGPVTSYDLTYESSRKKKFQSTSGSYFRTPSIVTVSEIYEHFNSKPPLKIGRPPFVPETDSKFSTIQSRNISEFSFKDSTIGLMKPDSSDSSSKITVEAESSALLTIPRNGCLKQIAWIIWWPVKCVYHFTIPQLRDDYCVSTSILIFILSMSYIGALSYLAAWMVSVLGNTLLVPDSVMGLTFLAVGNSLPEIISTIIISKQSMGNMALSNALGGNVFTLLMCLGAPWLVSANTNGKGFVQIHSQGITSLVLGLLAAVILMLLVMAIYRFYLNKKVGAMCLFLYLIYVVISCLHEMNIFGPVNKLPCRN